MILMPKGIALTFFLLFTIFLLALGIYGYTTIAGSGENSASEIKAKSERMLFISVIAVSTVLTVFIALVGGTIRVTRELDKIIEANKYGDFSPELSMKKLGRIGERINRLYYTLNALNEKKTLKISALSELAEYLVQNVGVPLLVSDVLGTIVYVSRTYADRFESNRSEILHMNITKLYPSFQYHDAVLELDKGHSSVEWDAGGVPISLVPVQNRQNALSYVILIFDRSGFVADASRNVEIKAKNGVHLLSRFLSRRNQRG